MDKILLVLLTALTLIACKKEIVVFDNDPNAQFELPLILKLNDKNGCFNAKTDELKYTLDEASLAGFSPFIQFQKTSVLVFEGRQLENNTVNDLGNIEWHKVYTLEVTTGKQTKTLKVVFTNMPMVQLVTFDDIPNEPKALARMTIHYPEKGKVSQADWIGIEQRGASSLAYDKKSYGITVYGNKSTENAVSRSYFGFNPNEDWIMDAMYIDESRLRNKTSFELWSSLGTNAEHAAIQSRFTEVFLNHRSLGLYCFSENFTRESLQLNTSSVYYRSTDNSAVTAFESLPQGKPQSGKWAEWEQKYPKPSKQINWKDFNTLSNLIVKGSDAAFKNEIGQLVDLDNVIDYFLFINLCGGSDNVGKNWGFLKRDPAGKFIIVPWDLDATWGRTAFGSESESSMFVSNAFFGRLMAVNPGDFSQRLKQRWMELRANQFSQANLVSLFESNVNELTSCKIIQAENNIWHQSLNLLAEKAFIETWITARLSVLDTVFQ